MKTFKTLCITSIVLLIFTSCSSDDDSNSQQEQQTTIELLTSGKWYFESKSTGTYTDCEKKGYIQFMTDGSLILNSFDDSNGSEPCESLGEETAGYTIDGMNITLIFGSESENAVIDEISADELKTTNLDTGESNVFDKNEG